MPVFLTAAWLSPAFGSPEPREIGLPDVLIVPDEALKDDHEQAALSRFGQFLKVDVRPSRHGGLTAVPYIDFLTECLNEVLEVEDWKLVDVTAKGRLPLLSGRIACRLATLGGMRAGVDASLLAGGGHPRSSSRQLHDQQLAFIARDYGVPASDFRALARRFFEDGAPNSVQ